MSIVVFDSGLGGLSVLDELQNLLPTQQIHYVADDAGFPYGDLSEHTLIERVIQLFEQLIALYKPRVAVIACNTATTLSLGLLRKRFNIPFVGIVPAIKTASEQTRSGLFSVLATPATVNSQYTHTLIERFAGRNRVSLIGADKLAMMVENHLLGDVVCDDTLSVILRPCFVSEQDKRTDVIVLACTHYPFLVTRFKQLAPWPVVWVNPVYAVARQVKVVLENTQYNNSAKTFLDQQPKPVNTLTTTSGHCPNKLLKLARRFNLHHYHNAHIRLPELYNA